jgi:hypothetical protein
MKRKELLRVAVGMEPDGASRAPGATNETVTPAAPLTPCAERVDFSRGWIKRFMENLDQHLDGPRRVRLLETRGRSCARGGAIRLARECNGDVDKLVAALAAHRGQENVYRKGNVVRLTYDRCLCQLVADVPKISASYCHCSIGWVKEMFETASGRPVRVEALETVKRGGSACRFDIHLEA